MKHDRLIPILQSVCYACDYDTNTNMKAEELWDKLVPLNQSMKNKHSLAAMYVIIDTALEIIKELECSNVINVEESLKEEVDLPCIQKPVKSKKKK